MAASGGTIVAGAHGVSSSSGAAYVFGEEQPTTSGNYVLAGFESPAHGSHWRARKAIRIATAVRYSSGAAIPPWLAALLSANCELTIRASGARTLASHCLRYDTSTGRFIYRWRPRAGRTGRVTLELELRYATVFYRPPDFAWERIIVGRLGSRRAAHGGGADVRVLPPLSSR